MASPDLPPELWLEAFSELEYSDLKSLFRVCKRFYNLLSKRPGSNHTKLDKTLLRESPVTGPYKPQGFALHPALTTLSYEYEYELEPTPWYAVDSTYGNMFVMGELWFDDLDDVRACVRRLRTYLQLEDAGERTVFSENAASPPVFEFIIKYNIRAYLAGGHYYDWIFVRRSLEDGKPLAVRDVLRRAAKHLRALWKTPGDGV